jgi:hypothetical protein
MTTTGDLRHALPQWIECRTLLHAWENVPYNGEAPRRWRTATRSTTIMQFRCLRCGTIRYDVWSNVTGDLVERAYRTPEGYALPKGEGAKVLVRREYLRRQRQAAPKARPKGRANLRRVS